MPNIRDQLAAAVTQAKATQAKINAGTATGADKELFKRQVSHATALNDHLKGAIADERDLASLNALGGTAPIPLGTSGAVGQLRELHKAGIEGKSAAVEIRSKDLLSPALPATVSSYVSPGDYASNVIDLSALWANEVMGGPLLRIYRVSSRAVAGVVGEGGEKPVSGLATDSIDIPTQKWAVRESMTTEAMSDFATLASVVQAELAQAIRAAVNAYVVTTAAGASGILSVTSASLLDGISQGKGQLIGLTGYAPSQVLCSPSDVSRLIEQSKSAGSGEYFVSPTAVTPPTIHGVPLISTPAVTAGTWLMGSFPTAGRFAWRETMTVQLGYATNDFETNRRSIVCEARGALGITRAAHLVSGKFA